MALDIIVDAEETESPKVMSRDDALLSWVMDRVMAWETERDTDYKAKWQEYERLWRGEWSSQDKNRDSERSRLIAPALSQAIESQVAELEEAAFGKGNWFDVIDDYQDEEKKDMLVLRNILADDMDSAGVKQAMAEVFLNGAIYGTGIAKIVVDEVVERKLEATDVAPIASEEDKVQVSVVPVHPLEFVIDGSAKTVSEALGCAHITTVPKHSVQSKMENGTYDECNLGDYTSTMVHPFQAQDKLTQSEERDKTLIIEYHGLVPRDLLPIELAEGEELYDLGMEDEVGEYDELDLVESVVTIANCAYVLRAIQSVYTMKDRAFLAYQHDTNPNSFWGRGVAEKGYNPQKALDAELRARMDAMALTVHPMMGIDASRIPRGADFSVRPGRNVYTNGDPRQVLMPFNFGNIQPTTFAQSGEMERMVQMGTGSMDSATPLDTNRRNETSSGMSMIMGGSIKRYKRTLSNIERMLLNPLVHKVAWRYMQFDPTRYKTLDVKFKVNTTLGMMAREAEQQQLVNLLQTVPPQSPAFWMLIKGVYENSSISNKEAMIMLIDQQMQQAMNPPPPQPDPIKVAEVQIKEREVAVKEFLAGIKRDEAENKRDKDIMDNLLKARDMDQNAQTVILQTAAALTKENKA